MGQVQQILGYRDQVIFVNRKMEQAINRLLKKSSYPTVIILVSDHGPGSQLDWNNVERTNLKERFSCFISYRLPEGGALPGTDDITQINLMRLVTNYSLGTDFKRLPDESYYSAWASPYKLVRVTDRLNSSSHKVR